MGKRGPKKKSDKLKAMEGNPGHRPLNKNEPEPIGAPIAPDYLDKYAKLTWKSIIAAMPDNIYYSCDSELLATYCVVCSQHRKAAMMLQLESAVDESGKPSGWHRILKETAQLKATVGTRLGLDPAARSAIDMSVAAFTPRPPKGAKTPKPKKPDSKFGHLTAVNFERGRK